MISVTPIFRPLRPRSHKRVFAFLCSIIFMVVGASAQESLNHSGSAPDFAGGYERPLEIDIPVKQAGLPSLLDNLATWQLQVGFIAFVTVSLLVFVFGWLRVRRKYERKLEDTVEQRTRSLTETNLRLEETARHLKQVHAKFVKSAHQAGMAEVATDVLHTIGNALNSVHVSANLVEGKVQAQRLDFLQKLSDLVTEHEDHLVDFFAQDKRGQFLPNALRRLATTLSDTQRETLQEIKHLHEQLFHINDIVAAQRRFTTAGDFYEPLNLRVMLTDVCRIQESVFEEFGIRLIRDFQEVAEITGPRAILLHIFNHLVKNACEALTVGGNLENRELLLRVVAGKRKDVRVEITDNGIGIAAEKLTKIFSQGYPKKGAGGGNLHYCANSIGKIGGTIGVKSPGQGLGATFVVELPIVPHEKEGDSMISIGFDSEYNEADILQPRSADQKASEESEPTISSSTVMMDARTALSTGVGKGPEPTWGRSASSPLAS